MNLQNIVSIRDEFTLKTVRSIVEIKENFLRKLCKDYGVNLEQVPVRVKIIKYPNDTNDYIYIDDEPAGVMSEVGIEFSKNHKFITLSFKAVNYKEALKKDES